MRSHMLVISNSYFEDLPSILGKYKFKYDLLSDLDQSVMFIKHIDIRYLIGVIIVEDHIEKTIDLLDLLYLLNLCKVKINVAIALKKNKINSNFIQFFNKYKYVSLSIFEYDNLTDYNLKRDVIGHLLIKDRPVIKENVEKEKNLFQVDKFFFPDKLLKLKEV